MPAIPSLGSQENAKAGLGYKVRLCLKTNKQIKNQNKPTIGGFCPTATPVKSLTHWTICSHDHQQHRSAYPASKNIAQTAARGRASQMKALHGHQQAGFATNPLQRYLGQKEHGIRRKPLCAKRRISETIPISMKAIKEQLPKNSFRFIKVSMPLQRIPV